MARKALIGGALTALILMTAPDLANAETPVLTPADSGPCADPWINYAYRTTFNRRPNGSGGTGECTIGLYAGGRWSSYDQLKAAVVAYVNQNAARAPAPPPSAADTPVLTAADRAPCTDQWINYAYRTMYGRLPNGSGGNGDCNIQNYANGRWSNYPELRSAIIAYVNANANRPPVTSAPPPPQPPRVAAPAPAPGPGGGGPGGAPGGGNAGGGSPGGGAPGGVPTPVGSAATRGPLPAVPQLQTAMSTGVQYTQNLRTLFTGMEAYTSGPNALYDPQMVRQAQAMVGVVQYLMNGPNNAYSVQKLTSGQAIALNEDERVMVGRLLAADPDFAALDDANRRLTAVLRDSGLIPEALPGAFSDRVFRAAYQGEGRASQALYWGPPAGNRGLFQRTELPTADFNLQPTDIRNPPNLTGLDRATNLAQILNWGRTLNNTQIFLNFSTQVEATLSLLLDGPELLGARVGDQVNLEKLGKVVKVYAAAKLAVQLTAVTVNAISANVPSSISNVYMNLGNRAYAPNLPPWPLNVGQTVDGQIFVVPHATGGSLTTPIGAVSLVIDSLADPRISAALNRVLNNPANTKLVHDQVVAVMANVGRSHVDSIASVLNNYNMSAWATSVQNRFVVPPKDYAPIEVNDARLVRMVAGPNVDLSIGPNQRILVRGVTPGSTRLVGSLNSRVPAFTANTQAGASTTFTIAIQVNGQPPAPQNQICYGTDGRTMGVMINGRCELAH